MKLPWKIRKYYHILWFRIYFPLILRFWMFSRGITNRIHVSFISIQSVSATLEDLEKGHFHEYN